MTRVVVRCAGVTLIELLVTLSIAAILMAIAVPSLQDWLRRNRVDSASSDLMAALNYARSEAIRRGVSVSVCKSTNGMDCNTESCAEDPKNCWERGWIIFTNLDNDSPARVDAGEDILRVHQALPPGITLRPNVNYTNFLTYRPDGRVNNIGTFAICANDELVGAKSITITATGRARYGNDSNNDGKPEKDSGGASVNINSCTNP